MNGSEQWDDSMSLDNTRMNRWEWMIADDLKIYTDFSHCNQDTLQHQLNQIQHWSETWQMKISHSKCNILTIGHSRDPHQYFINDNQISKADFTRDLGVTVDHELKFKIHINNIVQQANQRAAQIIRCFYLEIPPCLSELSKFTFDQSWNMRLQHGLLHTFTKLILLKACNAVSLDAFQDVPTYPTKNASLF